MLERSPLDSAVFSPERLDFVAQPVLADERLRWTPPTINYTEGNALDTCTLLSLSADEEKQVAKLKQIAKDEIKPNSAKKRNSWGKVKIKELIARGDSPVQAQQTIDRTIKSLDKSLGIDLYDGFVLTFANLGSVTVADVLNHPELYDGKALADPIEGVGYGKTTAKFYWNQGDKPVPGPTFSAPERR
jgi:hypothetical protein